MNRTTIICNHCGKQQNTQDLKVDIETLSHTTYMCCRCNSDKLTNLEDGTQINKNVTPSELDVYKIF